MGGGRKREHLIDLPPCYCGYFLTSTEILCVAIEVLVGTVVFCTYRVVLSSVGESCIANTTAATLRHASVHSLIPHCNLRS